MKPEQSCNSLKEALRTYGDPFVPFTIKSYRKALFQVHGTVTVEADHVLDTVLSAIHDDLRVRYAFDAREFGQPVALSQVVAAIQAIPGVVATDIDKFYRTNVPVPALVHSSSPIAQPWAPTVWFRRRSCYCSTRLP